MATMFKVVPDYPVSGFDQHIEDFREFFQSRGVSFGSASDLPPFVARLAADASFRDDMASMVRTVIYRERDGVSRLELVEMVAVAIEGTGAENADQPENRDAERKVVAFIDGVFRTRWNPGEQAAEARGEAAGPVAVAGPCSPVVIEERDSEGAAEEADSAGVAQNIVQAHPTTDLFYRAQVVAGVEPAEAIAEERKARNASVGSEELMPVEAEREILPATVYEMLPLHLETEDQTELPKKTSRFWMWTAGVCALVLAFCAGLFVHQRLMVPLRDANQPYEQPPADTAPEVTAGQDATAAPAASTSAVRTARAEEARWRGGARHDRGEHGRAESAAPVSRGAAVGTAAGVAAASGPEEPVVDSGADADMQPMYMAPAMIGASPALMASHLEYAPKPGYPLLAEMSHIRGRVLVEAVVGKNGHVIRAKAISGHRLLRGAAVREVYERQYRPYLLNDRPTNVATIVAVDFRNK